MSTEINTTTHRKLHNICTKIDEINEKTNA